MALGKPVVTFLHDEAVARTEDAFGTEVPIVSATAETLVDRLRPLVEDAAERRRDRRREPRLRRAGPRRRPRSPTACSTSTLVCEMALGAQIKRLGKHSAIYGLGGLVSRILAVLLLPLYTRYLGPSGFGKIETLVALTAVLVIVLRMGISSAFFRFYFDAKDEAQRTLVVRTSFWFTMTMATAGLVVGLVLATPIAHAAQARRRPVARPRRRSSGSGRR